MAEFIILAASANYFLDTIPNIYAPLQATFLGLSLLSVYYLIDKVYILLCAVFLFNI